VRLVARGKRADAFLIHRRDIADFTAFADMVRPEELRHIALPLPGEQVFMPVG
jgi:hypothetical protein